MKNKSIDRSLIGALKKHADESLIEKEHTAWQKASEEKQLIFDSNEIQGYLFSSNSKIEVILKVIKMKISKEFTIRDINNIRIANYEATKKLSANELILITKKRADEFKKILEYRKANTDDSTNTSSLYDVIKTSTETNSIVNEKLRL